MWVFIDYASGILLLDCSKLAINRKNNNDVTVFRHDVIVNFLSGCFVSLVKFSCFHKSHVNIITSSRVMTIYFCRRLTMLQNARVAAFTVSELMSVKFFNEQDDSTDLIYPIFYEWIKPFIFSLGHHNVPTFSRQYNDWLCRMLFKHPKRYHADIFLYYYYI